MEIDIFCDYFDNATYFIYEKEHGGEVCDIPAKTILRWQKASEEYTNCQVEMAKFFEDANKKRLAQEEKEERQRKQKARALKNKERKMRRLEKIK